MAKKHNEFGEEQPADAGMQTRDLEHQYRADPKVREGGSQASVGAEPPKSASADAGGTFNIVLRQSKKVGDVTLAKGDSLGTVTLVEGVSLNFLVDAIRNGLAGEEPPKE